LISIIGGLLLIIGAYFVFKGEILYSVLVYFLADVCWCLLAIKAEDYIGFGIIIIGMLLGLGAYFKMQNGRMRKNLHLKEEW